jgi:hypothetical protein
MQHALDAWVEAMFLQMPLCNLGNTLEHGIQEDDLSCRVASIFTGLWYLLHNVNLFEHKYRNCKRMSLFCELSQAQMQTVSCCE